MSTVLILGAGFTRAASSRAARARTPPLDADFCEIERAAESRLHSRVIESLNLFGGGYSRVLSQSLETAATYLYLKAVDGRRRDAFYSGFIDLLSLVNGRQKGRQKVPGTVF